MIDNMELEALLADLESDRVERTESEKDTNKFAQAVCAFANDMPNHRKPGYLIIGADNGTGRLTGLAVTDNLLLNLAGLRADGNILPQPVINVNKYSLEGGEVAVVEVLPSDIPPVRYKGQVWIRIGPRRGIANESEERILAERRTSAALTFDARPCAGSSLGDLALDIFTTGYRPNAIDAQVIAENDRPIEQQLASLRFFDLSRNCPTHAGILLFAKDPLYWIPNAYIQYVKYAGPAMSAEVIAERRFIGDLLSLLRELDAFVKGLPQARPVKVTVLREELHADYPVIALRELLMNAVMHRSYDSASFIRFYQYSDRIEISSPGPLYGEASPENFPHQTSYRNPVIAEAIKTLGFVNRFGRGVETAQAALLKNGNERAIFEFGDTYFGVTVRARS